MFTRAFMIPCDGFNTDVIRKYLQYGKILYSDTVFENDRYYEVLYIKCNLRQAFKIWRRFKKKEKNIYYIEEDDHGFV